MELRHRPVLLRECIEGLAVKPDGIYVDGTFGRGGHSLEIVRRLATGRLICIDRDETALEAGRTLLEEFGDTVTFVHANFREIAAVLAELGIPGTDGMLFDLGVSSPQLDDSRRGFSYMTDAPLDMRMDQSSSLTAYEVVNRWSGEELKRILYQYGEERYAGSITAAILRRREASPIQSTLELAGIIRSAMPAAALREAQHPAKRSFQAIRIAVNDELAAISQMITAAADCLNPGGRLAVISFHSLEDRIVKNAMQSMAKGCTCPPDFPVCVCGRKPTIDILTKKPVVPTEEELTENPRSRSAKLRIAKKR
ncbi:16S rRNA (cytosine(1402)-N(4))-methyltransferase RsmH [Papillibacter cinnamivorans]|uniref:Ribosomal RNA small subunit methyltransferase H n=1 Tax=Papillibacter cinnamivorans DSM 12816 TaxID=1122930 RepID=A0A1W1YZK1_9FIRM|nr:16S rRNA (cytosine(1402)-N(4))-methyltransferase RsmH [Papillibacter cinnamivorans]SMC41564.1 16S rRNA (cytosine1402-N4)-methyltransferase [Papillibacter cinnamivorans DSM 12816]